MKRLLVATAMFAISAAAFAALPLPESPMSFLSGFEMPSLRGGDRGRDARRDYYDDRYDRGRHRGHYKRYPPRRSRVAPGPVYVPVPAPPVPYVPAPPMPPRPPRPPGF
jgi:hypothetical protein